MIIIYEGDPTLPGGLNEREKLAQNMKSGKIIHLFGSNLEINKLPSNATQLPLGIHNKAANFPLERPDSYLVKLAKSALPIRNRYCKILCDNMARQNVMPIPGYPWDRGQVVKILKKNKVCKVLKLRVSWENYLNLKSLYAFEASPLGNGVDCYRTWEALALGSIVIVPSTFLDPLFQGLPVVKVKDWNQVTPQNLAKWLEEFAPTIDSKEVREKITHAYWQKKIDQVQKEYRQSLR